MRIGIVCQNYPPATFEGGISHYSERLAKALLHRGHEVYAITSTEFTIKSGEKRDKNGIKILRIGGPWNFFSIREIKSVITKENMDALVLQYSPASFKWSFRLKWALARFPYQKITAFHTLWGRKIDRLWGLLMLFGSQKIIATNSEIMFLIEKYLFFLLPKTYWIPIGSNILPGNINKPNHTTDVPVISYFGMLYPGKGLDLILDVLHELKKRDHRFLFKFVGGGMLDHEQYEIQFRNKIRVRELDDVVEHLGLIPAGEVSEWLYKSRFVFIPYESGLSDRRGSFMAAIAHGRPVLTSPPAVTMPFMENGRHALWPDNTTIHGFVNRFELLLSDDDIISRLENGARELSSHFSWEKIAEEHELAIALRQ